MTRLQFEPSETERKAILFLADHFNSGGETIHWRLIPGFGDEQELRDTIIKFERFCLVGFKNRTSARILPELLSVAHQLRNPPVPNYWLELLTWWSASKWRVGISVLVFVLPWVVQWIEMIQTVLVWTGVTDGPM